MGFLKRFFNKSEDQMLKDAETLAKVHDHRLQEIQEAAQNITQASQQIAQSHQRTSQRLANIDNTIKRLDQLTEDNLNKTSKLSQNTSIKQPSRISEQAKSILAMLPEPKSSQPNHIDQAPPHAPNNSHLQTLPKSNDELNPNLRSRVSQQAKDLLSTLPNPNNTLSDASLDHRNNNAENSIERQQKEQSTQTTSLSKVRSILTSHTDYRLGPKAATQQVQQLGANQYWNQTFQFRKLEMLELNDDLNFDQMLALHQDYAQKHNVDLNRSLSSLVPAETIHELRMQIIDTYTYRKPQCDSFDYVVAGTAGLIGGLIDIFLVDSPTTGILTRWVDDQTDNAICCFAKLCGWEGASRNANEVNSAIGFLERMFPVNYDQRFGNELDGMINMRPSDHHLKSLPHSPDLLGLFFSILDQFTNQAHFIADGTIISVDTENFELHGSTLIGKLFCGTANWLCHIISDVGGSSGSVSRGTGVPIPFFNLLQLANFGSIGADKQTIAQISTQVFTKGYDLRHGIAMAIPVLFVELVIRLMYVLKPLFQSNPYPTTKFNPIQFANTNHYSQSDDLNNCQSLDWKRGITNSPELERMLFVGHGTLCLLDAGDSIIKGKGNIVNTLLHLNIIAWVRFSFLAVQESKMLFLAGHIDDEKLQQDLQREYKELLQSLPTS